MSPRTEDSPVPSCLTERKASILLIFWPRCSTCVILVPDQGSNLSPLQWKCRGLATGPPREVPEVNILIMCKAMHSLKALVPFRVRLLKAPPSSLSSHGGFHDGLEWASCFSSLEPLCFLFPPPETLFPNIPWFSSFFKILFKYLLSESFLWTPFKWAVPPLLHHCLSSLCCYIFLLSIYLTRSITMC